MKCEWYDLKKFVDFLNESEGSLYELEKCLDIIERNKPQPEVLIIDNTSNKHAVIEKKLFYWPEEDGKIKGIESEFCEIFFNLMNNELKYFYNNTFVLNINEEIKWKKRDFNDNIKKIVNEIKKEYINGENKGIPIHRKSPIIWSFGMVNEYDKDLYDYKNGISIAYNDRFTNFCNQNGDYKEIQNKILEFYKSCEMKFKEFNYCKRILLIKNLSIDLTDEYIIKMVKLCEKPVAISEVWLETEVYIDEMTIQSKYIKIV